MNIILIGISHKTAPISVRERLALKFQSLPEMLSQTLTFPEIQEAFLISTCNRIEILVTTNDRQIMADILVNWLCKEHCLKKEEIAKIIYRYTNEDAIRHIFRVASSLDSLVVGEPQILGQIKEAYRIASQAGATGAILNRLLHKTFQVAKRVRSETAIGGAAVSISYAAIELARKIFDKLTNLKVLLIGAGEMAELAAEHLLAQGVREILVANRTLANAMELASHLAQKNNSKRGGCFCLEELERLLPMVDIVISSASSLNPIITNNLARRALKARRGRPLFFIDIAVPRNIEPSINEIDGCFIYDMDDLARLVDNNRTGRKIEAQAAEAIIAEEVIKFNAWIKGLAVIPTITELTNKAEIIRKAEIAKTLKNWNYASEQETKTLEKLTRSLTKKLLHDPILFLRNQAHYSKEIQRNHTTLVRRLFNLDEK